MKEKSKIREANELHISDVNVILLLEPLPSIMVLVLLDKTHPVVGNAVGLLVGPGVGYGVF